MKVLNWTVLVLTVLAPIQVNAEYSRGSSVEVVARAVFSEVERRVIRDYYRKRYGDDLGYNGKKQNKKNKKSKGMPPGLAKRDHLPPGLEKQLQRNGKLPPGLAKRNLPSDLESRLPRILRGYERVIADNRIILIEKASGVIADIIEDLIIR